MWSSKVSSKKHTQVFHFEDQSSQNNKKKFQDTMKSNNFVTREVPIKKFFHVDHCTNSGSGELSNFIKGRNYSMDFYMPELVVFIQEDPQQQYVKDICIDREVLPEGKCDMNRRNDLNLGIMETMSNNSCGSECSSQKLSFKEAMKVHGFRNLMKSEMELDLGDKISNDLHLTKKTVETLREAFKREKSISSSFENWQRNSCLQVTDTNMYRPDISYLQSFTTSSGKRQVDYPDQETSSNALDTLSGQHSCIAHAKTFTFHQSNDSIGSAHSFSFPILPVEWNGSPVRMMEADKSQSRKHKWKKFLLPCCDCDD